MSKFNQTSFTNESLAKDKLTLYVELYKRVKTSILHGEFPAGSKLPSKRNLSIQTGYSINTVLKAYEQLEVEGYIYSMERKGYFVADIKTLIQPIQQIQEMNQTTHSQTQEIRFDFTSSIPDQENFPFTDLRKAFNTILIEEDDAILKTSPLAGDDSLRQSIQQYLSLSRNVPCRMEQIVLGPSSQYLFTLLCQIIEPKSCFAFEDPGYHRFMELIELHHFQTCALPIDQHGLSIEELHQSKASLVYLSPNHQFPTGSIMPIERRQDLLEWASQDEHRYLIEDDYDSEFQYAGKPIPSLSSLDQKGKVIYMGSFSRSLATGFRMSYMVLPEQLLNAFKRIETMFTCPISSLTQKVMDKLMRSGQFERHLNRSRLRNKRKRESLLAAISQHDHEAKIIGAPAGLHILLKPSLPFDTEPLNEALKMLGLKIAFLNDFLNKPSWLKNFTEYENTIYLGFSSLSLTEIPQAVDLLYQALRQQTKKVR